MSDLYGYIDRYIVNLYSYRYKIYIVYKLKRPDFISGLFNLFKFLKVILLKYREYHDQTIL